MGAAHIRKIRRFAWPELRALWEQIEAQSTPGWAAGKAFEHLVLRAFELDGAVVRWPYSVSIAGETAEQIDGAVHLDTLSCLVESKDTAVPVNVEPIAKLRNQLIRRPPGAVGLLFSRSGFTNPALTLAQFLAPQTILLWNGDEIKYVLEQERIRPALMKKYQYCIETGMPDYDPRVEALP
jgi:hypothetical protein